MNETSETVEPTGATEPAGDDEAGTVRYRVTTLGLGPDQPTGSLPPGTDRVVIEADVVRIEGLVRWPSCAVEVSARVVEVVGPEPAVLDVSGAEPVPDFGEADHAPAGQPGASGGAGRDGGSVTLVVDRIVGALQIRSNGGPGGAGQGGGHGIQPGRRPAAKDGRFTVKKKFGWDYWKASGPYGGKVLVEPGVARAYVSVAYGAVGGRGHTGGAAGLAGRPGDGGDGGRIQIRFGERPEVAPTTEAVGGGAGAPGPTGRPAAGGAGAAGGRNRLYRYAWGKAREGWTNTDDTLRETAKDFRISHRAGSGPVGPTGTAPESPVAEPGSATDSEIERSTLADLGTGLSPELLALVLGRAEHDLTIGDDARAEARLGWLAEVTAERRDEAAMRINEAASGHLAS